MKPVNTVTIHQLHIAKLTKLKNPWKHKIHQEHSDIKQGHS